MIKDLDTRLRILNEESYDSTFIFKTKQERLEDLKNYFDEEYDDYIENIEDYELNKEYTFNFRRGDLVALNEALEHEYDIALHEMEFYNENVQRLILEHFYDNVMRIDCDIQLEFDLSDEQQFKITLGGFITLPNRVKQQLKYKVKNLKDNGFVTKYISDTMHFHLTNKKNIINCSFFVCL